MIDGVLLVWFVLAALSLVFVAIDVRRTPAHPVVRWAFVILAAFTGPLGAFFYVLGCREPLANTHERYVAAKWRQVLGSTMHCAAGDGLGIIAGAAIAAGMHLGSWADLTLEYSLGFGFGWLFFQAFAMRDMAGGSYARSLVMTFLPEFLSMNFLMAGMVAVMSALGSRINGGSDPNRLEFWFVMSMALIVGFGFAYPINGWLVARELKHGMFTVRRARVGGEGSPGEMVRGSGSPSAALLIGMTALSILFLALGIAAARLFSA